MNGISDIFATVSVPKPEYEELVRDSERLDIIKRYIEANDYISKKDIEVILGMETEKEGEEHESV